MDRSVFEYQLRKGMSANQEYDIIGLMQVYIIFMADEQFHGLPLIRFKTLDNRVNELVAAEEAWIGKRGHGKKAVFYKKASHRSNMSRTELLKRVVNKLIGVIPCRKW